MGGETLREQLEAYAREKYRVEAEQLPFNHEDYAIFRHADSGKWFAVFVVKSRQSFGLPGDGDTEIICLKIRNPLLADMLTQQPGYLRGFPSSKWNWVSIVLDGTVPIEEICRWLDESYAATKTKAKNQKVPLVKKSERIKEERKRKMEIKAVKFRKDGFYTQPFAFGGEEGMDKFDKNVRYRGSLQNYLIDTGDEVILLDTGFTDAVPEEVPDESSLGFTGYAISDYLTAFKALGYQPEQVTKILLTHRHNDHSGSIGLFPNAKVYVNADELGAEELKGAGNLAPVTFTDGPYYNFPESQKIMDGVYMVKAKGHTNGNSIVIIEKDGLFYMFHADITYVDEALYENKVSVVYDDLAESRVTLDRVREFVRNHPTVYLGTHTPQGYENLEAKRVIDLDNPVPTVYAEVDFSAKQATGKYICSICGYVYDPAEHDGVAFDDLPDNWKCPRCKQPKEKFNKA